MKSIIHITAVGLIHSPTLYHAAVTSSSADSLTLIEVFERFGCDTQNAHIWRRTVHSPIDLGSFSFNNGSRRYLLLSRMV